MTYTITITENKGYPAAVSRGNDLIAALKNNGIEFNCETFDFERFANAMNEWMGKDSVSLEWTTEAPKVAGLYMAEYLEAQEKKSIPVKVLFPTKEPWIMLYGSAENVGISDFSRWLGPIPLALGGGE